MPVLIGGRKDGKAARARRKIRRLTRALGTVRELDVTLGLLDEMAAEGRVPRAAVEDVRAHVLAERDRRRERMLERLERVDPGKLRRRLAAVAEREADEENEAWRATLGARLVTRARRLDAAIADAGSMYLPERLHAVRIAAKKLRYALELAGDAGVAHASRHVRTMKRAQDLLGRLHDLQILQAHAAAVQADGGHASHAALETMGQQLEDRCRRLHADYMSFVPRLAEVAAATRRTVVPQLAGTAGRRAPVKMRLEPTPRAQAGGR